MPEPTDPATPANDKTAQRPDVALPATSGSSARFPIVAGAQNSDPEFAAVAEDGSGGDSPHKPRTAPRHRAKGKVECHKGAAGSSTNIGEALIDVSEKGAKVIVKEAVDQGRTVELRMYPRGENKPIVMLGKVVRCEPMDNGSFSLGVKFEKHIQFTDLRRLT